MALTTGQINFVSRTQAFARILKDQYGEIVTLDSLWIGTDDYQHEITDPELAEIPAFVGITVSDLNEMLYIIGNLKSLISARLEPLAALTE